MTKKSIGCGGIVLFFIVVGIISSILGSLGGGRDNTGVNVNTVKNSNNLVETDTTNTNNTSSDTSKVVEDPTVKCNLGKCGIKSLTKSSCDKAVCCNVSGSYVYSSSKKDCNTKVSEYNDSIKTTSVSDDVPIYTPQVENTNHCCKTCTTGKACGDSCISRSYTCHKAPGCACDG